MRLAPSFRKPMPGTLSSTGRLAIATAVLAVALGASYAPRMLWPQNSGAARDAWQHPGQVLDELGVRTGDVVADVGCGKGYFTRRLAQRVGPTGKVYAVDLRRRLLTELKQRATSEHMPQIVTVVGAPDDPRLPAAALDVVFAMNTYHEWRQHSEMLQHILAALKPGGTFALIDGKAAPGEPRSYYYEMHRMPEALERSEATAAGFVYLHDEPGFTQPDENKTFYFMVFKKPN